MNSKQGTKSYLYIELFIDHLTSSLGRFNAEVLKSHFYSQTTGYNNLVQAVSLWEIILGIIWGAYSSLPSTVCSSAR